MPNPQSTPEPRITRGVMLRDFIIFQLKLLLDGVKDLFLINASIIVLIIDLVADGHRGRRFYALMRMGEEFDLWLNLYRPARKAAAGEDDGLFGSSAAGSPTFLGHLEQVVRGGDEPGGSRDERTPPDKHP